MTAKFEINLLQKELFPKKPLLTLKRVAIGWGVAFGVMMFLILSSQFQAERLNKQVAALNVIKKKNEKEVAALEVKLANHKADTKLVAKLETLKMLVSSKRSLHAHLTNKSDSFIGGFADAMQELSEYHSKEISLQHVVINEQDVLLAGKARKADSVPAWLAKFEESKVLSGKSFSHFNLVENDDKLIDFVVSSETAKEGM